MTADVTEQKRKFALELLRTPNEPFKAATAVCGDDTGTAVMISTRWPNDPDVLAFQAEYVAEKGEMDFLPSKAALARAVWNLAEDAKLHVEDRLKAYRLYGDIRGFVEKQGAAINNNIVLNQNKVMLVEHHGSNDDWEQKMAQQQQKLITDASYTVQ